jgi:RecA/RadA recombinase
MAKRKKKADDEETVVVDFNYFKQEIEKEGVRVMSAGEMEDPEPNYCSSYNLDYDLIVPFPEGRITEVFGAEGTCKTTLILEILGQALLRGKTCLYVNMEKNLNLSLMRIIQSVLCGLLMHGLASRLLRL